jgi:hypothetical protein
MSVKFSNNATTELASSIGTSDTSITVVDASKFPILTAGDYTYVTLDTDTASPTREIVKVTAISGNVLTVARGQDGTSPASFAAGTKVELRLTAALLNDVAGANPSGEPIGFPDKSQTTITFDSGIRTFSITPTGASFDVYCKGVKYTYTTVQLVTIPNTTGLHFIYFNASGVLSTQMSYFTWEEHAPTAYVYWNATTQQAIYFGDERHGITLDWQTHEYLHRTRGAAIANGFAASGYTTTGLGATDADAQIDIGGGTFFDEDMQVDIVSTNTPVAGTWQQDLSGPARIPVMYLSGAAWVIDSPTNFPFKVVSSVPQYNLLSGSTWSTASVTNNSYFVSWILATNNLTYPVISIISQAPTNQLSVAEAMTFEGLNLNGFPSVEFRPLYKVIYQFKDGFANSVKSSTIAVYDLRSISSAGVAAALVQDHGNLSGLTDDDHPQYVHTSEVRTPSAAVKNSFFPSQVGQTGKYLSTDGTNTVWEPAPSGSLSFTGDVTGTGSTGSSTTLTLAASGAVAGQYTKVTVDAKGRVTAGTSVTSSDVTTALGYTPYNATNPAGYTTNVGTVTSVSGTGTVSGLTLTGSVTSSGSLTLGGTLSLTSGQVTSALGYTPPQPNGTGATGTWAINITGGAERLSALGNYVLYASTNGRDFANGIQAGFVDSATNGYPQYGSVVRIKTYPNDGGTAELYFPYGASYGGSAMRYRLGQYNNAGWTSWKTVLDDSNYSGYALPLSGGTLTGKTTFPSAVNDRPQVPGGVLGIDTGDGNFDIWGISRDYYPSHATASNAWGIRWDGDSNQVRFIGAGTTRLAVDLDGGASGLTWEGNAVAHSGNFTSFALSSGQVTTALGYTPLSNATSYLPLSGGTLTGSLSAPNFRDGSGAFNVNLGSSSEGRGAVAGFSGGAYGGIGFNVRHTSTSEQYVAPSGDTVSYLRFDGGGFRFYGSAVGAAGRTVTFTGAGNAFLDPSGNWYTAGQMYATGSQHLVLNTGNVGSYALPITGGTLTGDLQVSSNWGGSGYNEALTIYGTYPSMTYRSTTTGSVWLHHMQSDGAMTYYYASDAATSSNWAMKARMGIDGQLYFGSGTAVPYLHVSNVGTYALPLSGGTLTGAIYVGTTGSGSATRALRVGPSGGSPESFGSYSGSWRSTIEIWDNAATRMLHLTPPDGENYNWSSIKSVGAGLRIDVGGGGGTNAVAIGTTGAVTLTSNLTMSSGGIGSNAWSAASANETSRIIAPAGAAASWDNNPVGAIKIRLPFRANNAMWRMTVKIYDYGASVSEYHIGTYSYADGGYQSAAYFTGSNYAPVRNVRFGNDGTYDCVWIGETNTVWSYPAVSVTDFSAGFRTSNASNFLNNWHISYVTSFGTVAQNISPVTRLASGSHVDGNTIVHAGNYTSYSPSLTGGGASGTWGINISGTATYATNVSNGRFDNYSGSYNNAYTWLQFHGGSGYGLYFPGSGAMTHLYPFSGSYGSVFIEGSRGGYFGVMFPTGAGNAGWMTNSNTTGFYNHTHGWKYYHESGVFYIHTGTYGGGTGYAALHAGNYTSYAPSLTGSGASGSWNITAARATRANGNFYIDDNYGCGIVGAYASTRYQGVFAMGDSYKLPADGTSAGNLYGLAWSYPSAGGAASNLASHGLLLLENGTFKGAWGGGSFRTPGDLRGTIFYDYDNTGYYLDPTSTTSLRTVGDWRADSASWTGEFNGKMQYHAGHWYIQSSSLFIFRSSSGANVMQCDNSGNVTFSGNVTAYSDLRLKENVRDLTGAQTYLDKISAKRFTWKDDGCEDIGFIAQDVEAAGLTEFVLETAEYDPNTESTSDPFKTLDYGRMVSVLWQAVKEQKSQITAMSAEINSLKERLH